MELLFGQVYRRAMDRAAERGVTSVPGAALAGAR